LHASQRAKLVWKTEIRPTWKTEIMAKSSSANENPIDVRWQLGRRDQRAGAVCIRKNKQWRRKARRE
jgi:hypothetical protein